MLRGNRCIILAAFGWLVLTGANQSGENRNAGSAAAKPSPSPSPSASSTPYAPYPDLTAEACYRAKDHDTADLCAQWRAAIAAEKAAQEASRAATWTIVATFLSAAALIALLITLIQSAIALHRNREANRLIMKENARNTVRSAASARDTAKALEHAADSATANHKVAESASAALQADRAWICSVRVNKIAVTDGLITFGDKQVLVRKGFGFDFLWKNYGGTPALDVEIVQKYELVECGTDKIIRSDAQSGDQDSGGMAAPGQSFSTGAVFLTDEETAGFRSQKIDVLLKSVVSYREIFTDEVRETEVWFRMHHHGGLTGTPPNVHENVVSLQMGRTRAT